MSVLITEKVGEGEEKTPINSELFNSACSSGRKILIFFEERQTTGTILGEKKNKSAFNHLKVYRTRK